MERIRNKKAAITVVRQTRSFSLWEMIMQVYTIYMEFTKSLQKVHKGFTKNNRRIMQQLLKMILISKIF